MADKKGSAAELAELYPAPRIIPVQVKRVTEEAGVRTVRWERAEAVVERLSIRECGSVLSVLGPMMHKSPGSFGEFADIIFDNLEEYYSAIGRAIHWPSERVAMMDGNDCSVVARAIYEANQDFFDRHLVPVASATLGMVVAAMIHGVGQMPSGISGATAAPTTAPVSH